jgi:hypothetical protein
MSNLSATRKELLKELSADPGNFSLLRILADMCRDEGELELAQACRWCVAWKKHPHFDPATTQSRGYWYFTHDDARLHRAVRSDPKEARLPYAVFRAVKRVRAAAVRFPRVRFTSYGLALANLAQGLDAIRRLLLIPNEDA